MKTFFPIVFYFLLLAGSLHAQFQPQWIQYHHGTGHTNDFVKASVMDNDGNVFIVGQIHTDTTALDIMILYYDTAGTLLWQRIFHTPGYSQDYINAATLSDIGTLAITGTVLTDSGDVDMLIIGYDNTGTLLGANVYDNGGSEKGEDITADQVGFLYVAGSVYSGGITQGIMMKTNYDGSIVSSQLFPLLTGNQLQTIKIKSDAGGNVFICGTGSQSSASSKIFVKGFNSSGIAQWTDTFSHNNNTFNLISDFKLGPENNIYLCASSGPAMLNNDIVVCMYDSSGNKKWCEDYSKTPTSNDEAIALSVNSSGEVFIYGSSYGFSVLLSYDSTGVPIYAPATQNGVVYKTGDIHVDSDGKVIISGIIQNIPTGGGKWFIMTYNGSGVQTFSSQFFETQDINNTGYAIHARNNGYFIAGTLFTDGNYNDFGLAAFDSTNDNLWQKNYDYGQSGWAVFKDVATDNAGNIYVVGEAYETPTNLDVLVIKYNSSGQLLWRKNINGLSNGPDYGHHILVDNAGDIYVSCMLNTGNLGTYQMSLIKYNSSGTHQWQVYSLSYAYGYGLNTSTPIYDDGQGHIYFSYPMNNSIVQAMTMKVNTQSGFYEFSNQNSQVGQVIVPVDIDVDTSGNVYVTGYASTDNNVTSDVYVQKISPTGSTIMFNYRSGTAHSFDNVFDIEVTDEGNVYVAAVMQDSINGKNIYIYALTNGLNFRWEKIFNGSSNADDSRPAIVVDENENIYSAFTLKNGQNEIILNKLDSAGNEIWSQVVPSVSSTEETSQGIQLNPLGEILVLGQTGIASDDENILLSKFDTGGNFITDYLFSDSLNHNDNPAAMTATTDGKIYLCGRAFSNSQSHKAVLIQLRDFSVTINESFDSQLINVFPNPVTNRIILKTEYEGKVILSVYDVTGKRIDSQQLHAVNGQTEYELNPAMESGLYLLELQKNDQKLYAKIIRQ